MAIDCLDLRDTTKRILSFLFRSFLDSNTGHFLRLGLGLEIDYLAHTRLVKYLNFQQIIRKTITAATFSDKKSSSGLSTRIISKVSV